MSSVREATVEGRLVTLRAVRDVLATAVDMCESDRDLPGLTRQLVDVLRQIDELDPPVSVEVDEVDEIAQRRAARHAGSAKGSSRSKRSS